MELKKYQRVVINDLESFMELLDSKTTITDAYDSFWNNRHVVVGFGGVPPYNDQIKGVPHVCFKIPTGGGKTFVACSSLKPIFTKMPASKKKVVVWLVPSDSILEQTIKNLKNPLHPYRQKLDSDFNSRVEIFTKKELLSGQNFNVSSVNEQLSILVLTFDTFRIRNKEGRKIYQENGYLEQFTKHYEFPETLVKDVDESALIQVINQLMPVVVVDESHNATSQLSIEMIKNINPSFILDLTATPRENSNVIVYVDASQLKKESMVKLPVIAYNRPDQQEVIIDAIDLRIKLEKQAIEEEKKANETLPGSGRYIRPIVLFQAQPKNSDDSTTFDKLKDKLIKAGIPKEQIAIKTAEINELKNVDLMSRDCPIRYIITVNALKEGWDCPFAYILATLANKTSKVDVEQIVGRILRQPYTTKSTNPFLNMSYVLTSSNDFQNTLQSIIVGLNNAGFTSNDVRLAEVKDVEPVKVDNQITIDNLSLLDNETDDEALDFDPQTINNELVKREEKDDTDSNGIIVNNPVDVLVKDQNLGGMFANALSQSEDYDSMLEDMNKEGTVTVAGELREKMNIYKVNGEYEESVQKLIIPQFFVNCEANLFGDGETLLTKERLTEGFILSDKPIPTNLTATTEEIYQLDVSGDVHGSKPNYKKLSKSDITQFKEYLASIPSSSRVSACKNILNYNLGRINCVSATELKNYIDRIIASMDTDQLVELENNIYSVCNKLKNYIEYLIDQYRTAQFFDLLEKGIIFTKESYQLPIEINPVNPTSFISKSLYNSEQGDLNSTEHKIINQILSLDNVVWWHRIIERGHNEFNINGFINHYPDFMLYTIKGRLILLEVKGEHLANQDTVNKVKLGKKWDTLSGDKFRYYMVFLDKEIQQEGAYNLNDVCDIIKNL